MQVEINDWELWVIINAHMDAERRHANRQEYGDASDEKARATYLRTLLPETSK